MSIFSDLNLFFKAFSKPKYKSQLLYWNKRIEMFILSSIPGWSHELNFAKTDDYIQVPYRKTT